MRTAQHRRAQEYLEAGIASGLFREGEYLPPVEELARRTKASPHAVRRAVRHLGDRGVLWSVRKRGTRVLRRPALGRALFMSSWDAHTNLLLQEAVNHALIHAHLEVEFLPYLFRDGAGFEQLRHLAGKEAHETVLVTLVQEMVPADVRPDWERFAARFVYRVGFQFEDQFVLPGSLTVLPDPLAAAHLVAEHLLGLGHRRIGVVAGGLPDDGSVSERRAAALAEMLTLAGAECFPYHYSLHAGEGVPTFVKRNACTAWWAINDFQALEHSFLLQQASLRVPQDISVVGANDTPWAIGGALPLTTLSLDPPRIAAAIATAVETALTGAPEELASQKTCIRPILVPRASTAAVPNTEATPQGAIS